MKNLSYWEKKEWFSNIDHLIIGSGIVGLSCALQLKRMYPNHKVLVLEKGLLPQGASTKNAGFACFGSVSELLADLKHHSAQEVFRLVQRRWRGLQYLRELLGDNNIDYQQNYGYELFLTKENFEQYAESINYFNQLLKPLFKKKVYQVSNNYFEFKNVAPYYITNLFEAQLDTGKMMRSLLQLATKEGILILNGQEVTEFSAAEAEVTIVANQNEIKSKNLFVATNGFANKLLNLNVKPARAQVLITEPVPNLHIKGTFHLDEGFYYFRNIDNRILLGGGRNLDFQGEQTTDFGQTQEIQNKLEELLTEVILPDRDYKIEGRWSGIMGVGQQKSPIVKKLKHRVYCGVRLGGMGVAIGAQVGKELAGLLDS